MTSLLALSTATARRECRHTGQRRPAVGVLADYALNGFPALVALPLLSVVLGLALSAHQLAQQVGVPCGTLMLSPADA